MSNTHQQPAPTGPSRVALHTHSHTFAHSRSVQSTHRTTFVRAWCAGLHGQPAAQLNFDAQLSDMDVRLRNMHNTLAAVQRRSHAVVCSQDSLHSTPPCCNNSPDPAPNTVQLRRAVNQNLQAQMEFYNMCMAEWAGHHHGP
ncbi:hypothetical protein V8C86DRAFT_2516813 [Haematococcus lacustris]